MRLAAICDYIIAELLLGYFFILQNKKGVIKLKRDNVRKIILPDSEVPKQWYNILADMPNKPAPYISPVTGKEVTPDELSQIFAMECIKQEVATDRYIDIPDPVRELYKTYRPTPLHRAVELEKALGTPARIYYKYEGGNATGSHKLNSALAQAYYNKAEGIKKLTTETGAGQWGSALSMACQHFGMELLIYMVKVSYNQKPHRRTFMEVYGGRVISSPSNTTHAGREILEKDPDCGGSLGIAISEAVEIAAMNSDTNYSLGSVLNHVALHQTVIGLEAKKQLEMVDEYPDIVFACCGGGSNFNGIANPFLMDKFKGNKVRTVAVEPESCPTLTKGVFAYDYGDTAKTAPIAKMYTLGHEFMPAPNHAGGLRYHGDSAILSQLHYDGFVDAEAYGQRSVYEAGVTFARAEGIIPAPESAHAIKGAIEHALKCKESGKSDVILIGVSGHGYFDMSAYENYMAGKIQDLDYDPEAGRKSMQNLPKVDI